jgi:hypothetical protein
MALRNGSRLHVSMQDVFPHGCHLVPESIVEAQDYDEHTGRRSPAVDKHTGQRVFQVRVMDMDPELEGSGPGRPCAARPPGRLCRPAGDRPGVRRAARRSAAAG